MKLDSAGPSWCPIVSITTLDSDAVKGPAGTLAATNTAMFKISRSENTNVTLHVRYRVSGTSSNGVDYQSLSNSVVIPAGHIAATVLIRPIDDLHIEGTE